MLSREYHENIAIQKEAELRTKGYRASCTSNYAHHKRIPDIIAISPDGKVVAVEMESLKPYESSSEAIKKRYVAFLKKSKRVSLTM
ncbi:MAG: hypothetical protein ACREBS_06055 [Nitrososphaerales archaeon]